MTYVHPPRELTPDRNGSRFGRDPADKIAFYGAEPKEQPSAPAVLPGSSLDELIGAHNRLVEALSSLGLIRSS